MAAPQVSEELQTLGREVTRMLHSTDRDPARIAQLKVRLAFLQRSGRLPPVITYSLLALVAELENDRESALNLARSSIAEVTDASDDTNTSFTNALAVLARFSQYEEAFSRATESINRWPGNIAVVAVAISQAFIYAQYDRGIRLLNHFATLVGGSLPMDMGKRLVSLMMLKERAEQLNMSEDDILERLIVARQAVLDFGLDAIWETRGPLRDGSFITRYHLAADRETCSECTFSIFEAFSENFADTGMALFSIICVPLEDYYGPGDPPKP